MNTDVTFQVHALDGDYSLTASSSATKGYLEELQAIADKSGKSFQDVLQEEQLKISLVKKTMPADSKPQQQPTSRL